MSFWRYGVILGLLSGGVQAFEPEVIGEAGDPEAVSATVSTDASPTYQECLLWARDSAQNEVEALHAQAKALREADVASFPAKYAAQEAAEVRYKAEDVQVRIDPAERSFTTYIEHPAPQPHNTKKDADPMAGACKQLYAITP